MRRPCQDVYATRRRNARASAPRRWRGAGRRVVLGRMLCLASSNRTSTSYKLDRLGMPEFTARRGDSSFGMRGRVLRTPRGLPAWGAAPAGWRLDVAVVER